MGPRPSNAHDRRENGRSQCLYTGVLMGRFLSDREVEERLKNMEVRAVDQTFRQHEGDDYLRWIDEGGAIGPESAESEQSFTSTGLWFSDSLVNWAFWLDE